MGNIYLDYLEKQAAKVVSQQESSMVAKRDAERAKREAAKDQELTPAQKNIKAKQEANAKAAKDTTVVTKPKPGANAQERLNKVLSDQKASKAPTEHFTSANSVDYSKPVVAKPAPNAVVPKTNGPENRTLSLVPKEDAPSSSSTPKPKPSVKPKVGPEVEHQTADHLSFLRKMIPKSTMGKVGLGLAGLAAVGTVGAAVGHAGHSKAAALKNLGL